MKLIKAYIRPIMLEEVYTELRKEGYGNMTVLEGEGTGQFNDPDNKHGSLSFPAMHTKVIKIEIAAKDEAVESIIEIIKTVAYTGKKGDGVIFVSPIGYAVSIHDGREGAEVLQ